MNTATRRALRAAAIPGVVIGTLTITTDMTPWMLLAWAVLTAGTVIHAVRS